MKLNFIKPESGDWLIIENADTSCGETVTYFFNLEKEVKF